MGRAKRLGTGTRKDGLAIEYVRTRKVVRLLGWLYGDPIEPVEIPVDELCSRLGIDPRDVGKPHNYLLFAGSHRHPAGGLRDLVATYDSEEEAWAAFRELRQSHPSAQGWGELAAIDGTGQVNQLAWFGLHPAGDSSVAKKHPLRRLLSGEPPAYLRAVTPS
ncbi:MAG TPA: hypothetical protein VNT52_04240 [Acidimicrobiales bacterium]|nr:hypothetical protein [Acidimicrobiales bacterium]